MDSVRRVYRTTIQRVTGFAGIIFYAPKRMFFGVTSIFQNYIAPIIRSYAVGKMVVTLSYCNKLIQSLC